MSGPENALHIKHRRIVMPINYVCCTTDLISGIFSRNKNDWENNAINTRSRFEVTIKVNGLYQMKFSKVHGSKFDALVQSSSNEDRLALWNCLLGRWMWKVCKHFKKWKVAWPCFNCMLFLLYSIVRQTTTFIVYSLWRKSCNQGTTVCALWCM